ncbi:unnamed protein product [Amoebophrya sp. A25]|nr:unnamed protein product [Amoebophrya sp. A25]|eukprot:GSA25T00019549001.1
MLTNKDFKEIKHALTFIAKELQKHDPNGKHVSMEEVETFLEGLKSFSDDDIAENEEVIHTEDEAATVPVLAGQRFEKTFGLKPKDESESSGSGKASDVPATYHLVDARTLLLDETATTPRTTSSTARRSSAASASFFTSSTLGDNHRTVVYLQDQEWPNPEDLVGLEDEVNIGKAGDINENMESEVGKAPGGAPADEDKSKDDAEALVPLPNAAAVENNTSCILAETTTLKNEYENKDQMKDIIKTLMDKENPAEDIRANKKRQEVTQPSQEDHPPMKVLRKC